MRHVDVRLGDQRRRTTSISTSLLRRRAPPCSSADRNWLLRVARDARAAAGQAVGLDRHRRDSRCVALHRGAELRAARRPDPGSAAGACARCRRCGSGRGRGTAPRPGSASPCRRCRRRARRRVAGQAPPQPSHDEALAAVVALHARRRAARSAVDHVARVVAEQHAVERRLAVGQRREQQRAVGDALRAGHAHRAVGRARQRLDRVHRVAHVRRRAPCAPRRARPLEQRAQRGLVARGDRARAAPRASATKRVDRVVDLRGVGEEDVAPQLGRSWRRRASGRASSGRRTAAAPRRRRATAFTALKASACGRWLTQARTWSWRAASISSTRTPTPSHSARILATRRGVGARRRRHDAAAAAEQVGVRRRGARLLAAGDRMRADEGHAGRQQPLRRRARSRCLTLPTSLTTAPGAQRRRAGARHRRDAAHRHGEQQQVGVARRIARIVAVAVDDAAAPRGVAGWPRCGRGRRPRRSSPAARAASASEPPMRPTPAIVTRSKSRGTRPSSAQRRAQRARRSRSFSSAVPTVTRTCSGKP